MGLTKERCTYCEPPNIDDSFFGGAVAEPVLRGFETGVAGALFCDCENKPSDGSASELGACDDGVNPPKLMEGVVEVEAGLVVAPKFPNRLLGAEGVSGLAAALPKLKAGVEEAGAVVVSLCPLAAVELAPPN